jgi:hypothetical protein
VAILAEVPPGRYSLVCDGDGSHESMVDRDTFSVLHVELPNRGGSRSVADCGRCSRWVLGGRFRGLVWKHESWCADCDLPHVGFLVSCFADLAMRYRLRTLLIVVTVSAMLFAWAAYMRRMAEHHRNEAASIMNAITTDIGRGFTKENVREVVDRVAAGNETKGLNSRSFASFASPLRGSDIDAALSAAVYHQRQANRYEKAMLRPWIILSIKEPPASTDAHEPAVSET